MNIRRLKHKSVTHASNHKTMNKTLCGRFLIEDKRTESPMHVTCEVCLNLMQHGVSKQ